MEVLEKLRNQPREIRSQIALWSSGAVAFLVGLVWLSTLGPRFQNENTAPVTASAPVQQEESSSLNDLFSDVGAQIGSVIDSFKEKPDTLPATPTTTQPSIETKEQRQIQIVATSTPEEKERKVLVKPGARNTAE